MENQNKEDLEEKVWYRVVKVLYGIGWLFVILFALLTIYVLQPNTYTDMDKSYITCLDGTKYNLNGVDYNSIQKRLTSEGDRKAKTACIGRQAYPEETKMRIERAGQLGWSEDEIAKFANQDMMEANPSSVYQVSFVQSTNGSWRNAFTWAIAVAVVGYVALELIKKTVMYILTGKKFY